MRLLLFLLSLAFPFFMLGQKSGDSRPNVILIMADDMGYECLSANGSTEYETPILDGLAKEGIRFTKAISQPLCTPSRVKIMTGKYNYRNYEAFTWLNSNQRTFGNVMKEAGYATCIVGKWQLNGLVYEKEGYQDNQRPHAFGFDEYCLWQLTQLRKEGERFADPLLEQNGELLARDEDAYGPDIVSQFAMDFIDRNKDRPFFVYYPMLLVHDPFVPTPDSDNWAEKESRYKQDTTYFADMMKYTDKIVGRIIDQLKSSGVYENTLLIFTADNGTHPRIYSATQGGQIRGAKGNTIDHGTHVPLIMSWPEKVKKASVYKDLIEFSDFYATLADIVGKREASDGKSFLPLLLGEKQIAREEAFVHYDPMWGKNVNKFRNQFARSRRYKLYQDGKFFDLDKDVMEVNPLSESDLSKKQKKIRKRLEDKIAQAPKWK
ncbi:MAG: sulfatase-like hydrolase/transferase [Bacteroidia bacterium]|nr:sulfatase-like hydrolase/transferase [Bacteroidia bacterium]